MPTTVDCTHCSATLNVKDELIGKKVQCPKCSTVLTVEQPEGVVEAVPVAARKSRDEKYCTECAQAINARAVICPKCGVEQPTGNARDMELQDSKRIPAGIFALLLGGIGVHKFYLGYTGAGIIQILITICTCGAGHIIPLIEGIIYLCKSDPDFVRTYQRGQRAWF